MEALVQPRRNLPSRRGYTDTLVRIGTDFKSVMPSDERSRSVRLPRTPANQSVREIGHSREWPLLLSIVPRAFIVNKSVNNSYVTLVQILAPLALAVDHVGQARWGYVQFLGYLPFRLSGHRYSTSLTSQESRPSL